MLADVLQAYDVDRDRVYSGGYSSGGFVAQRMAALHPDRFAAAVVWSSAAGNDIQVAEVVGNLRHVPTALLYAAGDYLQTPNNVLPLEQAYAASDSVFTFYYHPVGEHLTFAVLDNWQKEAAYTKQLRVVRNPTRVTYRTKTDLDNPKSWSRARPRLLDLTHPATPRRRHLQRRGLDQPRVR